MSNDLDKKISNAMRRIDRALQDVQRPVIAYSGGKDSIVVADIMARRFGLRDAAVETSFYFSCVVQDLRRNAKAIGLNLTEHNSLGWKWLAENAHIIFSTDNKVRGWTFARRQQRTMDRHAKLHGYDAIAFGRRREENTVKAAHYSHSSGTWRMCPLIDWRTSDVWAYFDRHPHLTRPSIYQTAFGKIEGTAPFYTLSADDKQKGWQIVYQLESAFVRSCAKFDVSAADFLATVT